MLKQSLRNVNTTHLLEWPKSQTMTTPCSGEEGGANRNSPSLLMGMQNAPGTLEDPLAISYKTKHTLTVQSRSCVPLYLPM